MQRERSTRSNTTDLPAFPESGHYENLFTIDSHRDVY